MPDVKLHRLSVRYTVAGIKCVTTHVLGGQEGGNEDPAGLTADWVIACQTEFRAILTTDCTLNEIEARPIAPTSHEHDLPYIATIGLVGTRTATGDLLQPSWCLNATYRTDRSSRSARGRGFYSGAQEVDTNSSGFTTGGSTFHGLVSAYLAKMKTAFELGTAYSASGFSDVFAWYVFSRTHYTGGLPQSEYARPVRSYVVRTGPRSLRSRRA